MSGTQRHKRPHKSCKIFSPTKGNSFQSKYELIATPFILHCQTLF